MMSTNPPIVDCSALFTGGDTSSSKEAESIFSALQNDGLVFLQNHGIPRNEVANSFDVAKEFFDLPLDIKRRYKRTLTADFQGCAYLDIESFYHDGWTDLKEMMNLRLPECEWPNELSMFRPTFTKFRKDCDRIAFAVLRAIAQGLHLKDTGFFEASHHVRQSSAYNSTNVSLMHYPPVPYDVKTDQLRCQEHTDWTCLTLLFCDSAGGLQAEAASGEWFDVPVINDAVMVMAGNLMQRWTADRIKAIKHRVIVPEDVDKKTQSRFSLVYFLHADNECIVECLDGSDKYPPIAARDHYTASTSTYFGYPK